MQVKKQQLEPDIEQRTNSKSGKEYVCQGCILSPYLFNLYAEYFMRNTGLEEAQAGIKIARRNINNLRHANDTTLMAESKGIPEKNIYLCFIDYAKAFDCVDHNKLWKTLKEIGIPDIILPVS